MMQKVVPTTRTNLDKIDHFGAVDLIVVGGWRVLNARGRAGL